MREDGCSTHQLEEFHHRPRGGNFSSDDVVQAFHTTPKDRALSL